MQDWNTHRLEGDAVRPDPARQHEWLLTAGQGAYAMGTVAGCPTRRYHGLLVAATHPPVGRILLLNQVWERLTLRRAAHDAAHDAAPAAHDALEQPAEFTSLLFRRLEDGSTLMHPGGAHLLERFERGLSVVWHYAFGPVRFRRELMLHWKPDRGGAATLRYTVDGLPEADAPATLRLAPMLTLRDFHGLLHEPDSGEIDVEATAGARLTVSRGGVAATLACRGARFVPQPHWWRGVFYPADAERGQEDAEDLFVPGAFELELSAGRHEVALTVALGRDAVEPRADMNDRAAHLRPIYQGLTEGVPAVGRPMHYDGKSLESLDRCLAIAADDFVVDRAGAAGRKGVTILAGYPWFADWGRDTFIALPGLLLQTGRFDAARGVLELFAAALRRGLVPNRFDDYDPDAAHYNTVDASLWFVHAALRYVETSGDDAALRGWLGQAVASVLHAYADGTDADTHGGGTTRIAMDDDGLIAAGETHTQLTWMDAATGDTVFTPRPGKAVEINALWHYGLCAAAEHLADARPADAQHFASLAKRARHAFPRVFWNDDVGGLFDHVWIDPAGRRHRDESVRPNQVFAVSLAHSPLGQTKQRQVVRLLRERLLTPFGLRTLPPDDPHYHPRYTGPQFQRDEAYHQGTIWPWLIGPYAEAVLRVGKFSGRARAEARAAIAPLLDRLVGDGLGQLHEVHEAEPPHRPVGCIAQAWSVAEVLRLWRLIEVDSDNRR